MMKRLAPAGVVRQRARGLPRGMAFVRPVAAFVASVSRQSTRAPRTGDVVVDLDGAFVLPGLINAHDHLELNHYGPLKGRDRYENASAWIEDLRSVLAADPAICKQMSYPLTARLFIGGLKNLLAGVTTVAHHNPLYREIGRWFPVRVVRRYGWAHSFLLERQPVGARGEPGGDVRAACVATPSDTPFIVHVGEGVDEEAAAELSRLETLGCLRENTVLVHGVALSTVDWTRVLARGASLVWCPASNAFLFGRTAPVRQFLDVSGRRTRALASGSDSRVTGAAICSTSFVAHRAMPLSAGELLAGWRRPMRREPHSCRLPARAAGPRPVAIVAAPAGLPPASPPPRATPLRRLLAASRQDVRLVVVGGPAARRRPGVTRVFLAAPDVDHGRSPIVAGATLADSGLARQDCAVRLRSRVSAA